MESSNPISITKQSSKGYYNRNLVQAKLNDALYIELIKYCSKEKFNINSFLKITIAYYLEHHHD